MEKEGPRTPAQRMEEMLKAWIKDFSKTPYVYPVSIAISALIFYLVVTYAAGICLIILVPPLVLLGLLWMFNVRRIRRLALVGLIGYAVFSLTWVASYDVYYNQLKPGIAQSENGNAYNGTVSPLFGQSSQVFNYTVTVQIKNGTPYPKNVTVAIIGVKFPSFSYDNVTMSLLANNTADPNRTIQTYYYSSKVSHAVNAFWFWVSYPNGTTILAGTLGPLGTEGVVQGPVIKNAGAIIGALAPFAFYQTFFNAFIPFYLILGMIWWTRRARRMREQQIDKWKQQEAEKEATQPKTGGVKVPSRAKASGADKGSGETFVCSECGGDVPADATVCPHCGEKFD